jgi:P4 family phage/plasmid primase-like protien
MSTFDAVVSAVPAAEDDDREPLEVLSKKRGAESRAGDEIAETTLRGRFRYNPGLGWLEWDERRWNNDETVGERVSEVIRLYMDKVERTYRAKAATGSAAAAAVFAQIKDRLPESELLDRDGKSIPTPKLVAKHATPDEKEAYEAALRDGNEAKTQADIWLNLLAAARIAAVTRICQGMDGVLTRSAEFDSHPDLLNARNCVVDLRDKSTRPHDPGLLITHLAGGNYDPTVTSETWKRALDAVHPDVAAWFQMRMGQGATGHTPDDDALILGDGAGENGKSAVSGAIRRALGSYARLISHRVLIAQPGQHPTELMDLRGLRFALLEETPEEGRLNTHQLKMTIGTPQITARRMRRDDVTFDTTHTLVVHTNHRPVVDTTDHGTWRRLKAMPWPFTFRKPGEPCGGPDDKPGDPTIKPRLETETDVPTAVLTWLVDGAATWYAQNRISGPDPRMVREATSEWRRTSDVGLRFAAEHLTPDPRCYIPASTLRAEFNAYLGSQGKHPWTATTINERFPASLAAAGIPIWASPRKTTTITTELTESHPPPLPPQDGINLKEVTSLHDRRDGGAPPPESRPARVWAGVRFMTHAEMAAPDKADEGTGEVDQGADAGSTEAKGDDAEQHHAAR